MMNRESWMTNVTTTGTKGEDVHDCFRIPVVASACVPSCGRGFV